MSKNTLPQKNTRETRERSQATSVTRGQKGHSTSYYLRYIIVLLLIVGGVIVAVVGINAAHSLAQASKGAGTVTPSTHVTTLTVQRTAPYEGLSISVTTVQEAPTFSDDAIHAGKATVRLNLHIANTTPHPVSAIYYDVARLLVPKTDALTPTNMQLATETLAGKSQTGWLDFSLPKNVSLTTLTLQLGSVALNELLVKIPFTGHFDASQYADHIVSESLPITYDYYGHMLLYHLTGVEVRTAFHGSQCNAGQRFYILDFSVDNPETGDISPGYGFDYVRLVLNGNDKAPLDTTLPYTFKANAKGVKGYVVFAAQAGLKSFTLGLLSQNGNPEQDTSVVL